MTVVDEQKSYKVVKKPEGPFMGGGTRTVRLFKDEEEFLNRLCTRRNIEQTQGTFLNFVVGDVKVSRSMNIVNLNSTSLLNSRIDSVKIFTFFYDDH